MLEVNNKLYIQRFFAKQLPWSDLFKAVTYTQYEGEGSIPWFYQQIEGETSTLDLTKSTDELLSVMKSNTRNEIKRAIKEGVEFSHNEDYESFVPFYNDFCEQKGIDYKTDVPTLKKYNRTIITVARYGDTILAMHATVVNTADKVAMLLYSCSHRMGDGIDRKIIGWGNRFLHYKDFEYFKELGIERYEWNGICTDPSRPDVYNISLFKLSFGSEAKRSLSLRTPLFMFMKWCRKKLKR